MGLVGLVGVRGEGGIGENEGVVDMRFDSLVPAFSSTLWAMDCQLEERSGLTICCERVVATEKVEGGRGELLRIEGSATWPPLSTFAFGVGFAFSKSTGSSHKVASVISDPALDGLCGCEKEGCRVGVCVSAGEGSDVGLELEWRRR